MTIHVEYECESCHRKEPATYCGNCSGHHPPGGWYEGVHESGDLRHHCGPCFEAAITRHAEKQHRRSLLSVVPSLEKT